MSRFRRDGWFTGGSDPERELAQAAKKAGFLRAEYLLKRVAGVHEQAVRENWPTLRLDEAVNELEKLANEVWGQI